MGAAPRYLGSKDAWRFKHPSRGVSKTSRVRIRPYASTMAASACCSRTHAANSGVFTLVGWCIFRPNSCAARLMGGGCGVGSRPTGRSGWHTTATTSVVSWSAFSAGTAMDGVPKKIVRGRFKGRILVRYLGRHPGSNGSRPHRNEIERGRGRRLYHGILSRVLPKNHPSEHLEIFVDDWR